MNADLRNETRTCGSSLLTMTSQLQLLIVWCVDIQESRLLVDPKEKSILMQVSSFAAFLCHHSLSQQHDMADPIASTSAARMHESVAASSAADGTPSSSSSSKIRKPKSKWEAIDEQDDNDEHIARKAKKKKIKNFTSTLQESSRAASSSAAGSMSPLTGQSMSSSAVNSPLRHADSTSGTGASRHPFLQGCRSVYAYEKLNHIEEGSYGVVSRAREKETGDIVALKKLKMDQEKNGFPITSLREIKTLMTVGHHPNIVRVREIVVGDTLTQ